MTPRPVRLPRQLVVRVDEGLHDDLRETAEAEGRTVAQEVRYRLRRGLGLGVLACFGLVRP